MPFTFSHPAAVLPFNYIGKKYFSITALIVGSMVPDFEYFIRMKDVSYYSHTWKGAVWLDVPVGIAICFLVHNVVRDLMIQNLPFVLYKRFAVHLQFNWNAHFRQSWLIVTCSVFIGALSHLIWDRFTHRSYYLISHLPGFFEKHAFLMHHSTFVYRLFQTAYSLSGLGILLYAVWQLPSGEFVVHNRISNSYWLYVIFLSAGIYLINLLNTSSLRLQDYIGSGIAALLFAIIITSVITPALKKVWIARKG